MKLVQFPTRSCFFSLVIFLSLLSSYPLAHAQIPSGYVQTTATVPPLAGGQFGAAWTNLSTSPQLGLLGCVSTFQTTVSGTIDSNGHFSTLLADTAQICPSPSTWTFTLTFACPTGTPPSGFQTQVAVTGGGGTEDISSQIIAALPTNPCGGSGGTVNPGLTGQIAFYATGGKTVSGENTITVNQGGSANLKINIQAPPYSAVCDGVTNDAVAIQSALFAAGANSFSTIPTITYATNVGNAQQGVVVFPYGKTCNITTPLIVPPGVKIDLNWSTLLQTGTGDALELSYYNITGTPTWYGFAFNSIRDGQIVGPGAGTSTGSGVFMSLASWGTYQNLSVTGFKYGMQGQEVQYNTFSHVYTNSNVVGKYFTARAAATTLTSIDNTWLDDESDYNTKYGFWCQACSARGVYSADWSRNGVQDAVLGAQWGWIDSTHAEYVDHYTFTGGTGCTINSALPLTVVGTTTGQSATGYAQTNGSGVVTGVWGVTSGTGYTGAITATVAGCSSAPTITPVVANDSALGAWAGASAISRGGMTFKNVKVEHTIGPYNPPTSDGPTSGYAIGINSNTIRANNFEDLMFQRQAGVGAAPVSYAQMMINAGFQNALKTPGDPDNLWSAIANPITGGLCASTDLVTGQLTSTWGSGAGTNPLLYQCNAAQSVEWENMPASGWSPASGSEVMLAEGYQGMTNFSGDPLLQGGLAGDTTARVNIHEDGQTNYGGGSSVDAGTCRFGPQTLAATDGLGCNVNGKWFATQFNVPNPGTGFTIGGTAFVSFVGGGPDLHLFGSTIQARNFGDTTFVPFNGASYQIAGTTVISSGTGAPHGTQAHIQMSDNTGTSGHCATFNADGSLTDGPAGCGGSTPTFSTITSPIVYGGNAVGSTLTLNGSSNGSPVNAYVLLNPAGTGGICVWCSSTASAFEVNGTAKFDAGGTLTGPLNGTSANFSSTVGIGTSGPLSALNIESAGTNAIRMGAASDQTYDSAIQYRFATGIGAYTDIGYYAGSATFYPTLTLSPNMTGTGAGDVGIGTTNPGANLEVNGTAKFDSTSTFNGFVDGGTKFTISSGCSTSVTTGGALGGGFTATSSTCSPVISTGLTAPNGYYCGINDVTTPAASIKETAFTLTTVTFTGSSLGTTDVFVFHCTEF